VIDATQQLLVDAVRTRLFRLWNSGTQRAPEEAAGVLMFEVDKIVQQWIDEIQRRVVK